METNKVAVIGIYVSKTVLSYIFGGNLTSLISDKRSYGRMIFTIGDFLTKNSKNFDRFRYIVTDKSSGRFPNGTWEGIIDMVNRSEIDIGINDHLISEKSTDIVDFAFPLELDAKTFVTQKAEYKPRLFSILQTFSLSLWIAIMSALIAMSLVYYVAFKKKYSFDKILFHVVAVLLRQSSVLKPSSMIKKLLLFLWVVRAMFLCLAYDSVILSFLSFPTLNQVKDVSQLAKAVKEGHYHCVAPRDSVISELLLQSNNENLKTIGRDIVTNNVNFESTLADFYDHRSVQNVAMIAHASVLDLFTKGRVFVSQDRFLESMYAMPVRKDFCCKKLIEKFIHRFMASGLHVKYKNDRTFLVRLTRLMRLEEKDTSKRVLTLTDVAPAFIFLIIGHIISFLVLILEILSKRMKKKYKCRVNMAYKEDSN